MGNQRPSLVDVAEQALRRWLAPYRHRPGERLPPEYDLAGMLGVSRGTLRVALERLERTGEIVRRQGSGTFVGRIMGSALTEGLEVLESYASLARRNGVALGVRDLRIGEAPLDDAQATELGLAPGTPAPVIERTLLAGGSPAAFMSDVIHPELAPPSEVLAATLTSGEMVLDGLLAAGLPIGYARTLVLPRLISPKDPAGAALEVTEPTAALELHETMYVVSGEAVQLSTDIFAAGEIDLYVIRALQRGTPEQVTPPR